VCVCVCVFHFISFSSLMQGPNILSDKNLLTFNVAGEETFIHVNLILEDSDNAFCICLPRSLQKRFFVSSCHMLASCA